MARKRANGRVLTVRRRSDGSVTIEGDPPAQHTFSARWIAAHLGDLVDVRIVIHTVAGEVEYELAGFDTVLDGEGKQVMVDAVGGGPVPKYNFTALKARRI